MTGRVEKPGLDLSLGGEMHGLMRKLFPICRSITGNGVRKTLSLLREHIPLEIHEVPSGTKVFDWEVPREWNIRDAFILDQEGRKVVDFKENNLHVMGYSVPVDRRLPLGELQDHLYSLEDQPEAIPYLTSYYAERWGFCLAHRERLKLEEGMYRAVIDSDLSPGHLTYGECIIPGQTDREIFCSTNICHPSLANNELSGPVVLTYLIKWLRSKPRRYTYRMVFVPETIGAITYLSRHAEHLKDKMEAGFNISCVGDEGGYSYVASPYGDKTADRIAGNVIKHLDGEARVYPFLNRGSDERQYCSPGIDLPLVSLCNSKFGAYPEYHTSLDNLDFVTPRGLAQGFQYVKRCLETAEMNRTYRATCSGEPQLGKRGLYPSLGTRKTWAPVASLWNLIAYANGTNDLVAVSETIGAPVWELGHIALRLLEEGLFEEVTKESLTKA